VAALTITIVSGVHGSGEPSMVIPSSHRFLASGSAQPQPPQVRRQGLLRSAKRQPCEAVFSVESV